MTIEIAEFNNYWCRKDASCSHLQGGHVLGKGIFLKLLVETALELCWGELAGLGPAGVNDRGTCSYFRGTVLSNHKPIVPFAAWG